MKAITALAFASLAILATLPRDAAAATGFLKGESKQGLSKICFYDVLGEIHTINVSSVSLCPLSREFDIMPKAPAQQSYSSGGKMGFLKGERQEGLSKICFYDVLGETYALNVSSVSLCQLNHRF